MRAGRALAGWLPPDVVSLKPALERLYLDFNRRDAVADPVQVVRRYPDPRDREIAGFLAAGLAFGRVASVLRSIDAVLTPMGARPAAFVRRFEPRRHGDAFRLIRHRWTTGTDLAAVLLVLRHILDDAGSIEAFFVRGFDRDVPDITAALESFAASALDLCPADGGRPLAPGARYFFSRPSSGSACKRLNLFLRWMVRRDEVDLGVWSTVAPAQLIVPLDTHVARVGRCLGLTRRMTPGWRMAAEITASLRRIDPDDPVRYDFSLCHLSMMGACGFGTPQGDSQCPLRGACRPSR
jgi:uncharacterized protein (TIGR02757 family)